MASMTRNERATNYALRLKAATDVVAEVQKIRSELDVLVYSETEKPLDQAEKIEIVKEMRSMLAGGKRNAGGQLIIEASDNTETLAIIDIVISELGANR